MVEWYLQCRDLVGKIGKKISDALLSSGTGNKVDFKQVAEYARENAAELDLLWTKHQSTALPSNLSRHLYWAEEHDFRDIVYSDLPEIGKSLDAVLKEWHDQKGGSGILHLLDPVVLESSYAQFRDGHLRDAVLNSITGLFDFIRVRTGSTLDGDALAGSALSANNPALILSEIDSESGRNDQTGFMRIFQGAFQGIRNSKAHSLRHDLTETEAAQYLVFASLLARRIREAEPGPASQLPKAKKVSSAPRPISPIRS